MLADNTVTKFQKILADAGSADETKVKDAQAAYNRLCAQEASECLQETLKEVDAEPNAERNEAREAAKKYIQVVSQTEMKKCADYAETLGQETNADVGAKSTVDSLEEACRINKETAKNVASNCAEAYAK